MNPLVSEKQSKEDVVVDTIISFGSLMNTLSVKEQPSVSVNVYL